MKRIILSAALAALPLSAVGQDQAKEEDQVTYDCSVEQNCSSGDCQKNDPPFPIKIVHDRPAKLGTVYFGEQSAQMIAVSVEGKQEFRQPEDGSSINFSIESATGTLEIRAAGAGGSSLEKGICKSSE